MKPTHLLITLTLLGLALVALPEVLADNDADRAAFIRQLGGITLLCAGLIISVRISALWMDDVEVDEIENDKINGNG